MVSLPLLSQAPMALDNILSFPCCKEREGPSCVLLRMAVALLDWWFRIEIEADWFGGGLNTPYIEENGDQHVAQNIHP